MDEKKIRILLSKWIMDAHDRGVRTVAKTLADAGLEVVFTRFETPIEAVKAAQDEDVDIVGISCSMGGHKYFASEIMKLMEERNMGNIPVIFGGIIPPKDKKELLELGVESVFGPGTSLAEISAYVETLKKNMI